MSESPRPKPSLTRLIFPTQKQKYSFETQDLPVRFEGEGTLHTRGTMVDRERATTAHLDLQNTERDIEKDIQRTMYINTSGGYDVRDIFELTATRTVEPTDQIPLEPVGKDHTFILDYLTQDEEGREIPVEEASMEVPGSQEFYSDQEYSKLWGPQKLGDPWAEGTVEARKVDEGTEIEYTVTGHTLHFDTSLEDHLDHVLNDTGLEYRNLFSGYATKEQV